MARSKAGGHTEAISKAGGHTDGDDKAGGHKEAISKARAEAMRQEGTRRREGDRNNRLLRPKTGEMPERTPPPRGGRYTPKSNRRTWAVSPWEIHFFFRLR